MGSKPRLTCAKPNRSYNLRNRGLKDVNIHVHTPISLLYVSGGGMNCVSCDICVYHLGLCVCFPWGIPQLQSDWSLSCDHGLDYAS